MLTPLSNGGGGEVITYTQTPPPSEGEVCQSCALFSLSQGLLRLPFSSSATTHRPFSCLSPQSYPHHSAYALEGNSIDILNAARSIQKVTSSLVE